MVSQCTWNQWIFCHGDVRNGADRCGGTGRGERDVEDVESDLGGVAQQPGPGVGGEDLALDADYGGDVGVPVGIGQVVDGIQHADGAALVAVAAAVAASDRAERRRACRDLPDALVQARLVILDLDDQCELGLCRGLEMFF
jgi:hypothetical protein